MKLLGYDRIDSVKNGKEFHAYILHRVVPCTKPGSYGFTVTSDILPDSLLASLGVSPSLFAEVVIDPVLFRDFLSAFEGIKFDSYTSRGFENIIGISKEPV